MSTQTETITEVPAAVVAPLKRVELEPHEEIELNTRKSASSGQVVAEDEAIKLTKDTMLKLMSAGFSFFFAGTSDGCLGALIPYIIRTYGISTDLIAVIFAASFGGWVMAALTNSHLLKYLGVGSILTIGAFLQLLAHVLRVWTPPYPLFAVSFFFTSLGQAFQDSHSNTYVSSIKGAHRWLGFIHAMYALGLLVSPFVATPIAVRVPDRWALFYGFLIGLGVINIIAVMYSFRDSLNVHHRQEATEENEDTSRSKSAVVEIKEVLSMPALWFLSLYFFLFLGAGVTGGGWTVEFLVRIRGGDLSKMGYVPAGQNGGLFLGRLILAEPTKRWGERRMVLIWCILTLAFQLVFWLVPNIAVNIVAISFVGFFSGPFFATGISVGSKLFPKRLQATSLGLVFALAQAGGSLFPALTGVIASKAGVQVLQPIMTALLVATGITGLCETSTTLEAHPGQQPPNISQQKAPTARRHSRSSSTNIFPAALLSELKAQSESISAGQQVLVATGGPPAPLSSSSSSSSAITADDDDSSTSSAFAPSYVGFQNSIDSSVSTSSRTPGSAPYIPRRPSTDPSTTGPMSVGEGGSSSGGGPDEWLEMAKKCRYLPESDMKRLCELVKECLMEESNIQPVKSPVTVCGDIHGQFYDLMELFKVGGGFPPDINYVFLGDFVDRGYFSLETFTLLMCLKAKYPSHITLVRGNHESRQITQVYGFYEECQTKYGNASVWKSCCQVFDFLALAAIIDGKVLCVHGGLSPEIRTLDQIRVVARAQEIPHEGAFCDLVWSDPEDVDTWAVSPRGAGWLFGDKVASEFNHVNNLTLIARAHQLVNEGYKYHFKNAVVTVWSAPNYCYRCGNVASIMQVEEDLQPEFKIFRAVPDDQRAVPPGRSGRGEYFL
ncbi:hypothetical protein H072_5800 [Dactylellina haptotyla CBS 200.50]|uniref:Serine/threonine-protein phosphatase n=1 Tax=Dactylellina haptotyla (strain CBS 200.50) TaxID=1284197 RepID=S8BYI6_DACHA|nr:hypothetical protein H072_5800 [Dactylellina haptotyla CBS 200.50]